MSKWAKVTVSVLAFLLVLVGVAWLNRVELMLKGVEIMSARRMSVGPNRPVSWDTGADPDARPAGERPPNIVLILADDLGWNDLTYAGGGVASGTVPTPNIDSIAAEGVTFSNGYAANGTCAPSRAAIMSGRYGTRFGFEFTPTPPGMMPMMQLMASTMSGRLRPSLPKEDVESVPYEQMGMPPSEITIAELLQQRGYHTAHIGKWHLGRVNGMAPEDQGFDESLLMASGLYLPEDDPNVVNAKQDFDPIDRFLWRALKFAASFNGGEAFEPGNYLTDYYTEEAVKVIEANKDRPFFLYLAHWAPHTPLQASRADYDALPHIGTHRERVYAAMIRALDRGVGQVLDALRANGIEDNTLVFFTSDNGGAHYIGLPDVNEPFRGWKITLFEGGIHVPYFIKWPAQIEAGRIVDDPVHHFDIFATAAAAAGAPLPIDRKIDGRDLTPVARGEADGVPHERLFWRSGASQTALVNGWKLNLSDPPGKAWLFDMKADPNEQKNLADQRPGKLAELRAALAAHNAEQAEPAWPSRGSFPINLDKDLSIPDAAGDEYIYWSN
ncbi:MAG: sulfatase-like hydrolase/transferase [Deltaproteobacteria bacterium]|nr:sulfatase-like hydrolase/transferase [Deltaproteobacteria bacterium]